MSFGIRDTQEIPGHDRRIALSQKRYIRRKQSLVNQYIYVALNNTESSDKNRFLQLTEYFGSRGFVSDSAQTHD